MKHWARLVLSAVLPGHGERRPDSSPHAYPPHWSLPVCGGTELRGGGGDGEVQVGPEELLQEQRRALCAVWEELQEPTPAAAGRNTWWPSPWQAVGLLLVNNSLTEDVQKDSKQSNVTHRYQILKYILVLLEDLCCTVAVFILLSHGVVLNWCCYVT